MPKQSRLLGFIIENYEFKFISLLKILKYKSTSFVSYQTLIIIIP